MRFFLKYLAAAILGAAAAFIAPGVGDYMDWFQVLLLAFILHEIEDRR